MCIGQRAVEPTGKLFPMGCFYLRGRNMQTAEKGLIDVYCPDCAALRGRKKLLLKRFPDARGRIVAYCKGCKSNIIIDLGKEPVSRV